MILSEAFRAANDPALLARFTAAVWKAATDIVNEDPQATGHDERMTWAKLILNGQAQAYASIIARLGFSENATLQDAWSPNDAGAQITDELIQAVVSDYVTKLVAAGV